MTTGTIFDLRRYSIHDGPGIRTAVFFKGCPLSCAWCHNPESLQSSPELMFRLNRCTLCGDCLEVCPQDAITLKESLIIDRSRCTVSGRCARVCPTEALEVVGREMPVEQVMAAIEPDRVFYEESGGGATFTGGEPLAQPEFLLALLRACRQAGISTVLDTCGFAPWQVLQETLPLVDFYLYDMKLMDNERHQHWTGVSNADILSNLRLLVQAGARVRVRIPLIPGINDDEVNLRASAAFLSALNPLPEVELLPYHAIAAGKYAGLGLVGARRLSPQRSGVGYISPLQGIQPPDTEHLRRCAGIMLEGGIVVTN
jgi:pyruvate formate lyase activating enzyme